MQTTMPKPKCCRNNTAYVITYKVLKHESTINVCTACLNKEKRSEVYQDRIIKPFQRNAQKIVCVLCNQDVTETTGCNNCNSVFEKSQTTENSAQIESTRNIKDNSLHLKADDRRLS